ncbi:MAG: hypothetical protein IKC69_00275 [Clostridia bacterium]|nr:hypothetical protein [Clostridia bacterium]
MKKIISFLVAITFVVGAFCVPVFASYADQTSTTYIQYGTTAHDLRAYGLHTFLAYKVSAEPSLTDAGIDPAQYGGVPSDVAKLGDGLTLTDDNCKVDYTDAYGADYEDVVVTTYLAYNDEYVFIAEKVESPVEFSVVDELGNTSTLNTNVRYGLNQSTAISEAASRLSNTYAYEKGLDGYSVGGCVAGLRNYKKIDGEVTKTAILDYANPYSDWTLYKYSKNTAISYTEDNGSYVYEFEYRIPLNDVIFSAVGSYDEKAVDDLLASGEFYGSYLFQVGVTRTGGAGGDQNFYLSTGFAGGREICAYGSSPDTEVKSTWDDAVAEYWTNAKGESLSVAYVPSPVFHTTVGGANAPASTGFRPGPSGFGFDQFGATYQTGKDVSFTVIPDGVDNTRPLVGDIRNVPTKFIIRSGATTKLTGTFSEDFTTGKFNTGNLPIGHNILIVTFTQQRFDGSKWVNTSVSKNLSRGFTVYGSVMGSVGGSAQTGDALTICIISGVAMLTVAAGASFVVLKKKRVH